MDFISQLCQINAKYLNWWNEIHNKWVKESKYKCTCIITSLHLRKSVPLLQQGRNFREAMKAMASVAPQFGLVSLKEMACSKATVALMPHLTEKNFLHWLLFVM